MIYITHGNINTKRVTTADEKGPFRKARRAHNCNCNIKTDVRYRPLMREWVNLAQLPEERFMLLGECWVYLHVSDKV
jgi:hypothetical protein